MLKNILCKARNKKAMNKLEGIFKEKESEKNQCTLSSAYPIPVLLSSTMPIYV
jgi:hypothetical protein